MSKAISAGLLMFSCRDDGIHILLAHPGGPFFANKDAGAWSIPKGLVAPGEDLLTAAQREFVEETGFELTDDMEYSSLGSVMLKSGKAVHAWAFRGEWQTDRVPESNNFLLEWPPKSGRQQSFPEIDRAEMFTMQIARLKINPQQLAFLERLGDQLGAGHVVAD